MGGTLDNASFTPSLGFVAGNVVGKPKIKTFITEGRCVDLAHDLDAGAIWNGGGKEPPVRGTSSVGKEGLPLASIRDAMMHLPNVDRERASWLAMLAGLHLETDGDANGLAIAQEWSELHPAYQADATETLWKSFHRGGGNICTFRSVIREAEKNGWRDFDRMLSLFTDEMVLSDDDKLASEARELLGIPPTDPVAEITGQAPEPSRLTFLTPDDCEAMPPQKYIIKGLAARGDVACMVGAPGAGKSLLGPRLGYAVAQGEEVFGRRVRQGGVFYVAAEDGHGMRGRVKALRQRHGGADAFYQTA